MVLIKDSCMPSSQYMSVLQRCSKSNGCWKFGLGWCSVYINGKNFFTFLLLQLIYLVDLIFLIFFFFYWLCFSLIKEQTSLQSLPFGTKWNMPSCPPLFHVMLVTSAKLWSDASFLIPLNITMKVVYQINNFQCFIRKEKIENIHMRLYMSKLLSAS